MITSETVNSRSRATSVNVVRVGCSASRITRVGDRRGRVTVNVLAPGYHAHPGGGPTRRRPGQQTCRVRLGHPLGRLGDAATSVRCTFLASKQAVSSPVKYYLWMGFLSWPRLILCLLVSRRRAARDRRRCPVRTAVWPTYDRGDVFISGADEQAGIDAIRRRLYFRYDHRPFTETEAAGSRPPSATTSTPGTPSAAPAAPPR